MRFDGLKEAIERRASACEVTGANPLMQERASSLEEGRGDYGPQILSLLPEKSSRANCGPWPPGSKSGRTNSLTVLPRPRRSLEEAPTATVLSLLPRAKQGRLIECR
jgi:hypothetical protein